MAARRVCYWIHTGTPGTHAPMGYEVATLGEALADFRSYVDDCDRFGNEWSEAFMEVSCDAWDERTYVVGPRKGIKLRTF